MCFVNLTDKCEKPQDAGGCKGNFTRWSYDKESMTCKEFAWGGCQGNENNFLSERECHLRCKDSARSRGKNSFQSASKNKQKLLQCAFTCTMCPFPFTLTLQLNQTNEMKISFNPATVQHEIGLRSMPR